MEVPESGDRSDRCTGDRLDDGLMVRLPSGNSIDHCRVRLRRFIQFDEYEVYDFWGGCCQQPASRITRRHVNATNAAMLASSSCKAWEALTAGYTRDFADELAAISNDLDLVASSEDEVTEGLEALGKIVREISSQPGLTDMAASKVLHLLRPHFVAISDSYVREALGISGEAAAYRPTKGEFCAERMFKVQTKIRAIGLNNLEVLEGLCDFANQRVKPFPPRSHQCRQAGVGEVPVKLTLLRVLDILLWTSRAVTSHPVWKPWYEELTRCDIGWKGDTT